MKVIWVNKKGKSKKAIYNGNSIYFLCDGNVRETWRLVYIEIVRWMESMLTVKAEEVEDGIYVIDGKELITIDSYKDAEKIKKAIGA